MSESLFPWLALLGCILALGVMVLLTMLLALKTRHTKGSTPGAESAEENARKQKACIRCDTPLL